MEIILGVNYLIGEILVSIIVPVYNVESYLIKCINSILNQTYKNLEIILVNDGSTDSSGEICEQYSKIDNRIKVIHKENGGLSDARNFGIKTAKGKYILFVDSDDYIEENAVEKLLEVSEKKNLDVVCGNSIKISDYNKRTMFGGVNENIVKTGLDYLVECINNKRFSAPVWLRMYRADLIKNNNLYFKKGLLHEDENWTPKVLLKANRVAYINFSFYNYIIRKNSITQKKDKTKNIKDIIYTCNELEKIYNSLNISEKHKNILKDYLARLYMNTCTYGEFDINFYKKLVNKKFPLVNSYNLKTKLEAVIYIFSIKLYRLLKIGVNKYFLNSTS